MPIIDSDKLGLLCITVWHPTNDVHPSLGFHDWETLEFGGVGGIYVAMQDPVPGQEDTGTAFYTSVCKLLLPARGFVPTFFFD